MSKNNHEKLWEAISDIRENHLTHIEKNLERTATNVDWLMRLTWVIVTSSVGALVTALYNLFI